MLTRVHDVEQMFGTLNLFRQGLGGRCSGTAPSGKERGHCSGSSPLTTVYDLGDTFLLQAVVAGVAKDDLTIQLQGKHLEIKGEPLSTVPKGYTIHSQGRPTSGFTRSYTLPVEIDGERVTSSLENGILTLSLPKAEKAKKRQITIH